MSESYNLLSGERVLAVGFSHIFCPLVNCFNSYSFIFSASLCKNTSSSLGTLNGDAFIADAMLNGCGEVWLYGLFFIFWVFGADLPTVLDIRCSRFTSGREGEEVLTCWVFIFNFINFIYQNMLLLSILVY
jgi:hypothetical protein